MGEVQFIKTDGEDLVVLRRRDYDSLMASLGDPAAEDAMTVRILAETAGQTALPLSVWDRIEEGEAAVAVLADYRGLNRDDLVRLTGLSEPVIFPLLRGETKPEGDTLKKLCAALDVSPDVFMT